MKELSADAAAKMRTHRKALFESFGAVADDCPSCALEQKLSDIVGENSSVELGFDEMLENGPHPDAGGNS